MTLVYLITYTIFEIGGEKKKYKENIFVKPGFEPLCARLLDYKKTTRRHIYFTH